MSRVEFAARLIIKCLQKSHNNDIISHEKQRDA